MDNAIIRYVFDKKKQADNTLKKGLLQIEVRIQGTNKCTYISTGIHLFKNQFSFTNGFTCKGVTNALGITAKARRIYNQVEAFVLSEDCKKIEDVKNWKKPKANAGSFINFIRQELSKKDISYDTAKNDRVLIRQLEAFGKINTFQDLTYENISEFDVFLRKTIKASSTLNKRHSNLKHYIRQAINMELITKDPYVHFKMPSKKSKDPIYLTESEIKKITEYVPVNEKLEKIKDIFLFQIFTGMAYVDMQSFTEEDISEMEGYKVIRSNRKKTDEYFVSLFLPEAESIAEKYDYDLPKISNQKYNDYLKLLAAGAGINKNLTTHTARHTYATYLLNKGIPIETVSRAMGHSNIKQTQHYAKLLGKKIIDDMKKLLKETSGSPQPDAYSQST